MQLGETVVRKCGATWTDKIWHITEGYLNPSTTYAQGSEGEGRVMCSCYSRLQSSSHLTRAIKQYIKECRNHCTQCVLNVSLLQSCYHIVSRSSSFAAMRFCNVPTDD